MMKWPYEFYVGMKVMLRPDYMSVYDPGGNNYFARTQLREGEIYTIGKLHNGINGSWFNLVEPNNSYNPWQFMPAEKHMFDEFNTIYEQGE